MVAAEYIHFGILQQINFTDSKYLSDLSAVQRDYYINKAKNVLLEHFAALAENNDTVRQELRPLVVRGKRLTGTVKDGKFVAAFPADFYKPLKAYLVAKKGNCPARDLVIRRLPSTKIDRALKNPAANRFWDFEETIGTESNQGFEVYVKGIEPEYVVLDYIHTVPDVACPQCENAESYIPPEGGFPNSKNLEWDAAKDSIISLAVALAKKDRGRVQEYQADLQSILNVERVFN